MRQLHRNTTSEAVEHTRLRAGSRWLTLAGRGGDRGRALALLPVASPASASACSLRSLRHGRSAPGRRDVNPAFGFAFGPGPRSATHAAFRRTRRTPACNTVRRDGEQRRERRRSRSVWTDTGWLDWGSMACNVWWEERKNCGRVGESESQEGQGNSVRPQRRDRRAGGRCQPCVAKLSSAQLRPARPPISKVSEQQTLGLRRVFKRPSADRPRSDSDSLCACCVGNAFPSSRGGLW